MGKGQKEKGKARREMLAKYFFDISKLVFGGVVIVQSIQLMSDHENVDTMIGMSVGAVLTALSAMLANKILK